jgi:hypothetical protein
VPWSGIDIVTEYPVFPGTDDESDGPEGSGAEDSRTAASPAPGAVGPCSSARRSRHVDAGPEREGRVGSGSRSTASSTRAELQDPWHLAGPLDRMTGLPIAVSKQSAILLHACRC